MTSTNNPTQTRTLLLHPKKNDKPESGTGVSGVKAPAGAETKPERSTHLECGGAKGSGVDGNSDCQLPTGKINIGVGVGAVNKGNRAGGINDHEGVINFYTNKNEGGGESPGEGNRNEGLGAGAFNVGKDAGSIVSNDKGDINL